MLIITSFKYNVLYVEKLPHFQGKMAIYGKIFTVTFL